MKKHAALALTIAVGAAGAAAIPSTAGAASTSKVAVQGAAAANSIKDRYIVVFAKGTRRADVDTARNGARKNGGRVHFEYRTAITGFAATLPQKALEGLQRNPHVVLIEADQTVQATDTTQASPPWGLDRIDQRALPLSASYTYGYDGSGVRAYVIDTGVRGTHTELAGRVSTTGYTAYTDATGLGDCAGHGTHVAGTIGGTTYGVAKAVQIVPVRVLNCNGSGTWGAVIAGVDWATADHAAGQPAVANMSLGGGASSAVDAAVASSIADRITYAIAAGNSNANACNSSPARTAQALTVGATTTTDARASYSNYGSCVDLFAPGSDILSSWYTSDSATNTISGTSMATPHVAGVAALYLQANPSAQPAAVATALTGLATANVVGNPGSGSPNRLLYAPTSFSEPPPAPPAAGCTAFPTVVTGTLSRSGSSVYQPSSGGYTTTASGVHKGCLDGPNGADFDLYLQRRGSFGSWTNVASGTTSAPDEAVTYTGTAATYRWRVVSYSGSGSYTLGTQRP